MVETKFEVLPGTAIAKVLEDSHEEVVSIVERSYLLHALGESINPDSYFLKFPEKPDARIIALPAYLGGEFGLAGIKWVSSFPGNRVHNVQRASAVLVLNDYVSGYPFALLEGSIISAHRTAASAILAAEVLNFGLRVAPRCAIIGAGVIARTVVEYLEKLQWSIDEFLVYDIDPDASQKFVGWLAEKGYSVGTVNEHANDAVADADLVILTTTAAEPHLYEFGSFSHNPTILHLSLRDISVEILLKSQNVADDIEHCMKAQTSLHLAEQKLGNRSFVAGTLADILSGTLVPDMDRPRIFSPFGLGVLDLAVGHYVYRRCCEAGTQEAIAGFFSDVQRWK